jgi:hypothetical protein
MSTEDLVAILQAAVRTVDANMLCHVRENAVCLEMDAEAASSTYYCHYVPGA